MARPGRSTSPWNIVSVTRLAVTVGALLLTGCGGGDETGAGADAIEVARAHVGAERDAASTTATLSSHEDPVMVTITFEGLLDDSVTAERRIVTLERDGDSWRVVDDRAEYKCHSGRGQQDFAPALCR